MVMEFFANPLAPFFGGTSSGSSGQSFDSAVSENTGGLGMQPGESDVDWSSREVSDETGIPLGKVRSVDPYDDRWGDVWARSEEIHRERGHADGPHRPEHDQQAFREIFGK
jgi:hypothetical protein